MYDPTYESRDITRSKNHVINHCRKLEMASETPIIIFFLNRTERNDSKWFMIFLTYRESILRRSKIQIDLIDGMILFAVFMILFRLLREIEPGVNPTIQVQKWTAVRKWTVLN